MSFYKNLGCWSLDQILIHVTIVMYCWLCLVTSESCCLTCLQAILIEFSIQNSSRNHLLMGYFSECRNFWSLIRTSDHCRKSQVTSDKILSARINCSIETSDGGSEVPTSPIGSPVSPPTSPGFLWAPQQRRSILCGCELREQILVSFTLLVLVDLELNLTRSTFLSCFSAQDHL